MKERIVNGRVQYIRRIEEGENDLKWILERMKRMQDIPWMTLTKSYMEITGISFKYIKEKSREELKMKMRDWDKGD